MQMARKIHSAKFHAGKVNLLVVTDVAARGLDIPLLDVVVNYGELGGPGCVMGRGKPGEPRLPWSHMCGRCQVGARQARGRVPGR